MRTISFASSGSAPSDPGTVGTPALVMACLALTLSPISLMFSGRGPMKTKPERSTFSAKSAFSERKPYPGWIASASEYTTTVRMPISRQARCMRSAISPRLAIRIFSNMLAENEQRLPVLHRLAVFHEHRLHHAGGVGLDLIHQLHRLDDANRLAFLDGLADLDKGLGVGRRRAVKGTDHGGLHDMAFLARLGFSYRRRCRGGGCRANLGGCGSRTRDERRRRRRGDAHRPTLDDLHLLLALGDLQLRDAGLLHEVDQLFQLAQIHSFPPLRVAT